MIVMDKYEIYSTKARHPTCGEIRKTNKYLGDFKRSTVQSAVSFDPYKIILSVS